ncbi:MAG: hypothetical protein CVU81_02435 [Euryarchaeota archaeon HGW-Euryarchaeota-1]|nr:MAG: hypothetical protein CVU81_02435 [Euryarchaeota archaeon HGW-Euryarchaeota-1]
MPRHKGYKLSQNAKDRISNANKGRKMSEETKKLMSKVKKEYWDNHPELKIERFPKLAPEEKHKKMSELARQRFTGRKQSKEQILNRLISRVSHHYSKEQTRAKVIRELREKYK